MKHPEDNLIDITTDKEIKKLYKTFLEIIEEIQRDHQLMMKRISEKGGEEFSRYIDCFTPERYEQIRKRVLDSGNECNRNLIQFLSFFDSVVNVQRLNEAAQQRIISRRTIISPPVIV